MNENNKYGNIGKRWEPRSGQARYYVNDWEQMIGLHVERYKTGNVCEVWLDDGSIDISNNYYKRHIDGTKVWIGEEDGQIHVDYCQNDYIERRIIEEVQKKMGEVVE